MPPRYAYWTILVDEQPTAFRAALQDDLMPTFKRLRQKHPSARLVWFQNGKIWNSRLDAREAMRERGERGRAGDERQGGLRSRQAPRTSPQLPRTSRPLDPRTSLRNPEGKLEWKPKSDKPARRDRTWRPGGEHRDPRQKYKDAKKAKWTRFKQTIRNRWEKKQGGKKDDE